MEQNAHFDYIIVGNGLAGLQLALKMAADAYFDDSTIALIDPSEKNSNDKTWSFWEEGASHWDDIAHKSWSKSYIHTAKKTIDLDLKPYAYKSIQSIDFYNRAKAELQNHSNITFIMDHVETVLEEGLGATVKTSNKVYTANHVFDSRIPSDFFSDTKSISIIQHFKGLFIKASSAIFDPERMTMMDYRLKDGQQTTFTYVLPFSEDTALIEFTYFTAQTVEEQVYDAFMDQYIKTYLNIEDYGVIASEKGEIPMTTFDFAKYNSKRITKIGTGGGWVKASTGYSFKNTERKVGQIIKNLKAGRPISHSLFKKRYKFYDKVFLRVLKDENHKGEWIFEQFYLKNSTQTMFRFLDEESSLFEELQIMFSLFSWSFIKAFFKTL